MDCKEVKEKVLGLGADICGIAPVDRFSDAPQGFHPRDIHEGCRSVIVYASRFPASTLVLPSLTPYTFVRNKMVEKLDAISFRLSEELEAEGIGSVPIPSAEPYDYWDPDRSHGRGILSLKHAAWLAGMGTLGKNTLLINKTFGNMIWLGAVLVSAELEGDPATSYNGCNDGCSICLDACPQQALDGTTINQNLCRARSISSTEGGGWVIACNTCRTVCPHHAGLTRDRT